MGNAQELTFKDYEDLVKSTMVDYKRDRLSLARALLGLGGEAGEVQEKVKKLLRGDAKYNDPTKPYGLSDQGYIEIIKELGDVLWYVGAIAEVLGSNIEEIASLNIEKLSGRLTKDNIKGDGDNR
jgi:NTP pyrophosphatase (non-canonical NTP hydrolase)